MRSNSHIIKTIDLWVVIIADFVTERKHLKKHIYPVRKLHPRQLVGDIMSTVLNSLENISIISKYGSYITNLKLTLYFLTTQNKEGF